MDARHTAEVEELDSRAATAEGESEEQVAADGAETFPEDAVAAALAANSLYAKTAAAEKQVLQALDS